MTKAIARAVVACAGIVFLLSAWAEEVTTLPPMLATVSDQVGVLSNGQGESLSEALKDILEEDGIRVIVVIARSIRPESLDNYAHRLAQKWQRERSLDPARAVFIIMAVDDRQMTVMGGRSFGLDSKLSQSDFTTDLAPLLRERRYYEALTRLADRVHKLLHER